MVKLSNSLFKKINYFSVWFLVTFGILLNISASSVQGLNQFDDNFHFIKRHISSIIIGIIIYNLGKKLSFSMYKKFANVSIVTITLALFFVLTYGIVAGGSRRWIDLGVINLQPSEFAKPIIIFWIAYQLSYIKTENSNFYYLKRALALPILCCFFIYLEPDYGTTLTIFSIILAQILFSDIKLRYPIGVLLLSPIPLYLLAASGTYRLNRILTWWDGKCNRGEDLLGDCFQLNQSRIAISSGGLFGLGPGTSRARWGMLPNSHSDFIASIIGEEYGFIGLLILLIMLFLLIISFYGLAITSRSEFKRIFLSGVATWILVQSIFNLGGLVGLLPITGIVLPFIAYGGSAMVAMFIAFTISHVEPTEEEL
jgi:cell division protein FtsW